MYELQVRQTEGCPPVYILGALFHAILNTSTSSSDLEKVTTACEYFSKTYPKAEFRVKEV